MLINFYCNIIILVRLVAIPFGRIIFISATQFPSGFQKLI